jgi:hypothetical protein
MKAKKQEERSRHKGRGLSLDDLTIERLKAISKRYGLGSMSAAVRFLAAEASAKLENKA